MIESDEENHTKPLKALYETKIVRKIMCVERHQRTKVDYLPLNNPACKWGRKRGGVKASTCRECSFGMPVEEPTPKYKPADVLKKCLEHKKSKKGKSFAQTADSTSIYA